MVKYENGKIYKIESNIGDMVYYGSSTKQYLSQRMDTHRGHYKLWLKGGKGGHVRVYDLFEAYGIENCQIVLIELCPCDSNDELKAREAYYIKTKDCVNKNIPGRTKKEYREDNAEHIKEYREANKEKSKEYREANAVRLKEQRKEYLKANKEQRKEYRKEYYEANKEKFKEKETCECGSCYMKSSKIRHERTKKHQDFLKN